MDPAPEADPTKDATAATAVLGEDGEDPATKPGQAQVVSGVL